MSEVLNLETAIQRLVANDCTLTTLFFSGKNIGDGGAIVLAAALKENITLTTLDLQLNGIGDDGAKAIATALKENSTLTYVDLSCNNIGEEGAEAIADALRVNRTLHLLDLSANYVGHGGAKALANAFRVLDDETTSAYLYLRNNFGEWCAKDLALFLKQNSSLNHLDLSQNDIGNNLTGQIEAFLARNRNNRVS